MTRAEEYLIERIQTLEEELRIEKGKNSVQFLFGEGCADGEYRVIFKGGNVEIIKEK